MKGLDYLYIALLMLGSYLLANINFAKIISKCKNRDITKEGSGNPGTLNMLRTFGFFWAILNMILEVLKGAIPSLIGYLIFGDVGLYLCGLSAIVGHIYPVLFKFKGGKGVACCCGMFIVANWWVTLIVVAVCFAFVTLTSMGSVGTLGFVLIMSIIELCLVDPSNWVIYIIIALIVAIIFFAHRKNLYRLFTGQENPTNIKGAFKADVNKIKNRNQTKNHTETVENADAKEITTIQTKTNLNEEANIVASNEEISSEEKTTEKSSEETK